MCKYSIYIENIEKKSDFFIDIFDIFNIFENITIFSNVDTEWWPKLLHAT